MAFKNAFQVQFNKDIYIFLGYQLTKDSDSLLLIHSSASYCYKRGPAWMHNLLPELVFIWQTSIKEP